MAIKKKEKKLYWKYIEARVEFVTIDQNKIRGLSLVR